MGYFNKVMLMGNVTRDPELRVVGNDTKVCDFGLATNRRYRTANGEDREETLFVDCSAFGRIAEVLAEYANKGKPLFIEGRLKFDSWEDRTTGAKRNKISVVVETFQFVGMKESAGENRPGERGSPRNPRNAPPRRRDAREGAPAATADESADMFDDAHYEEDIPF